MKNKFVTVAEGNQGSAAPARSFRNGRNSRAVFTWIAVAAPVVALAAQPPPSSGWSRWRGPSGTGISPEADWKVSAIHDGVEPLWKANVGAGYSSVCVSGTALFTMGNRRGQDTVSCLNAGTGAKIWTHSYPSDAGSYPGPRAMPVLDGPRLYTFSRDGLALCLDAATGAVKWERDLREALGANPPGWGFASSPLIDGDLVLYNAGVTGCALNKLTGDTVWSSSGTGGYSTPVLFQAKDESLAFLFSQKALRAVNEKTGKEAWSFPWETSYDVHAADPLVVGKRVMISSGYGKGSALLDFSSGEPRKVWQKPVLACHFSSVVYLDGYAYGIHGNAGHGTLQCVDVETGDVKWEQSLGFGSLIAAGGKLIVLNESGSVFVAEASPTAYTQLASAANVLSRTCWTAPVLSNGRLYCRNEKGELVCLDLAR